jgi:hypothetical protein
MVEVVGSRVIVGGVYLPMGGESEALLFWVDLCLIVGSGVLFFFTAGTVLLEPEFNRLVGGIAGGDVDFGAGANSYLGGWNELGAGELGTE